MRLFKYLLAGLLFCAVSGWAKVNINTASADELKALKGIGAAKAERIVAYRKAHGPFASPEALLQVKGIGAKILENNRQEIEVSVQDDAKSKSQHDNKNEKKPEKINKTNETQKKDSPPDDTDVKKKK